MWQPPRDEEPLWSVWLDAAFWTHFAVGMVIWQASRLGDDNGIEWPMVLLLGFFAILTLWGAIESWLKAWRASHAHPGRGAAVH
jgi:hypothetical protein